MNNTLAEKWNLSGKVAVVTGAARGIGLATARLLRERGADIVATDRSDAVHALQTRPYRPQTNGKAERFIQPCLREWAYGRV